MGLKRDVEVQRSSKGGQAKLESQSKLSWNPIRIRGTVHTKIITQVTHQLRFRRSLYGWKHRRISFPTEPIQIPSVSKGNIETMRRTESVTLLRYHIFAFWAMYQVRPNRGTSQGQSTTLTTSLSSYPPLIHPLGHQEQRGFVDQIQLLLLRTATRCWLNCPSPVSRTPHYVVYSDWYEFSHLQFSCL